MKPTPLSSPFTDPIKLLKRLSSQNEQMWIKSGERMALKLFHQMSKRVPAYKDFLAKKNIKPSTIKTINDFKKLPAIDKNNYLRAYSMEELCWDGQLKQKRWTFSTTSGSTGEPYYFPRDEVQDWQYAVTAETYLLTNFQIDKKSTLYIDGFAMGAWIGGLFTYQAVKYLAERGDYQLSIITPGSLKEEIVKAVRNIGDKFDQVLIGGYPPFIKDTIDYGLEVGLKWSNYNLGFIFSADGFSETFRDYIIKHTGLKDVYRSTLNHYGLVDLGTVAQESPVCILIRRLALQNSEFGESLFGHPYRQPTFAQYNPEMFYFEAEEGNLICSAFSGLPLCRYDLNDWGGVVTWEELDQLTKKSGINLTEEIRKANISDTIWNLPFVYVHERSDFIVKLCGANIYPETVRRALLDEQLTKNLTGKFTMIARFDKNQDQYLEINVELKAKTTPSSILKKKIQGIVVARLLAENSEYQNVSTYLPRHQSLPKIVLWSNGSPEYFKGGGKQKWSKKIENP